MIDIIIPHFRCHLSHRIILGLQQEFRLIHPLAEQILLRADIKKEVWIWPMAGPDGTPHSPPQSIGNTLKCIIAQKDKLTT